MNDPNSKKIIFNKSMLVSLKAELLKKQDEVKGKKQSHQHKLENFKPPISKNTEKHVKDCKKSFKDSLKSVDTDELEANRRVRLALEKKTELYNHLADSSGSSQLAGQFLVDFNNKKLENEHNAQKYLECDNINKKDEDDEWVEFTDCLGRTRKCLKSDKEFYIKRDNELKQSHTKERSSCEQQDTNLQNDSNKAEMPLLVQKTNDYLQSLREKWEEKEKELVGKEKDIHYQDLLFDEARIHGVAYYSFSTDETERRKQMEELTKRRQETLQAQEESERLRKKRDELMAARVAAARARQRARAGLPPEEPKDNQKDFTTCLLEFLTKQKNEADDKAKEEEKKAKEEQEKERQKLREAHVREWDLGKEGVDGKVKKFREMTQEEYVEQQRSKRIDEFAPPKVSTSSRTDYTFDDKGRMLESGSGTPVKKTWADVRPRARTPPPPEIGDISLFDEHKGLYFSTSTKPSLTNYNNFAKSQEPTLIENELSDDDVCESRKIEKRKIDSNHVEIEPPPTYDYYGPTPKCPRSQKPFHSDIREAYAQGAKSLENKGSERQLSKQYDFTFD